MASYNELNALIDAYINRNGVQAITGQILNGVLKAMVEQLGRGYTIMGAATPTTDPGTPDGPECYFASETGTYTDFDGLQIVPGELALLCYTPTDGWTKNTIYEGFQEVQATIDGNVGTPSVGVSYANGVLSFDFHNMKGNPGQNGQDGQDGDPAGFGTIGADITGGVGTPGVTVESSGPDTAKNLQFHFTNLKGETGVTSVVATVDNTTGTPACTVSLVGQQLTLAFSGLKGAQGNTGSSVDYPFTIVNNLTTDDATQALSAAQGVVLQGEITQLEHKFGNIAIPVTASGKYVALSGGVGTTVPSPTSSGAWSYRKYNVSPGDVVIVNGFGGTTPRLWGFADNTDTILSVSDAGVTGNNLRLIAPSNAAYVIINDNSNKTSYFSQEDSVGAWLSETNENIKILDAKTEGEEKEIDDKANRIITDTIFRDELAIVGEQTELTPTTLSGYYSTSGVFFPTENYSTKVYSLTAGKFYAVNVPNITSTAANVVLFNEDDSLLATINVGEKSNAIIWPNGFFKIGISAQNGSVFNIKETEAGAADLSDSLTIDGEKLNEFSVDAEKLSIVHEVPSKNILDPSQIVTNYWIKDDGTRASVSASYGYYEYLPVLPSTQYYISNKNGDTLTARNDNYIAFYDENKGFISSTLANTNSVTTPATAAFVRISVTMALVTDMQPMMEIGSTRTEYVPFGPPSYKIKDEYINTETKPTTFGSFRSSGTLAVNGVLNLPLVYVAKNISIVAEIDGAISSVYVGLGKGSTYGQGIEITATKLVVRGGSSWSQISEYAHGLTLGTKTKLIIIRNVTPSVLEKATIKLIDDYGNIFSQQVDWGYVVGRAFAENHNSSGSVNVSLSFIPGDITKKIWLFGDSYFTFTSTARWTHYAMVWGYGEYLLNARGGENATEAISDFYNLLSLGARPSFAVWCLGMNGGSDQSGSVNPSWLNNVNQFIAYCELYGITPILATIPTVPTQIHTELNNWVRSQDYRYIDFAAAVEETGTNTWRGWGTTNALLSNDEVHPSVHGAVELAMRALLDFPELMKTNS